MSVSGHIFLHDSLGLIEQPLVSSSAETAAESAFLRVVDDELRLLLLLLFLLF